MNPLEYFEDLGCTIPLPSVQGKTFVAFGSTRVNETNTKMVYVKNVLDEPISIAGGYVTQKDVRMEYPQRLEAGEVGLIKFTFTASRMASIKGEWGFKEVSTL